MNISREICQKYALALIHASEETKSEEAVKKDIMTVKELFDKENQFEKFVISRTIRDDEKLKVFDKVLFPQISNLTVNFLRLVLKNKRISLLKKICEEFFLQLERRRGITRAKLITAYPFSSETIDWLRTRLELHFSKKFRIESAENPKLIAGFNFKFEDKMLDCSASKYLGEFKTDLMTEN